MSQIVEAFPIEIMRCVHLLVPQLSELIRLGDEEMHLHVYPNFSESFVCMKLNKCECTVQRDKGE